MMDQKICLICGATFLRPKRKGRKPFSARKYCSLKCSGEAQRAESPKRYRSRKINGGNMGEHRAIMEAHLGRSLRSDEVVHHVNENKTDNRIENLRVMSLAAHGRLHHPPINPVTSVCVICSTTFTPHKTKRGRTKTCSPPCRKEYVRQRRWNFRDGS